MITADTITDEQIREVAKMDGADLDIGDFASLDELTEYALAVDPNWPGGASRWRRAHRAARARCAEILNERAKEGK